jgi:hypothetical protein
MTYACGTNIVYENDEQELQVVDELIQGDDYHKGNESFEVKNHEDLICLYFEMESRNVVLPREI